MFALPFTVANIYHENFVNGETAATTYWQAGNFSVNLKPENDTPTADATDAVTVTQGTPNTVDVLAKVDDADDWDDLSIVSVAGKDGIANAFTTGTVQAGDYPEDAYAGMKYADITVSIAEVDKTIRVINDTTQNYTRDTDKGTHNLGSKLVVDLLDNFNFLRIDATLNFSFTYTAQDKAETSANAAANITAKGINDQPEVTDVAAAAAGTVTDENTKTVYTLGTEVTDADIYPANTETYKVNMATTTPSWICNYDPASTDPDEVAAYNKIAAKMNALTLSSFFSTKDTQGDHTITFDPVNNTDTENPIIYFSFLGEGEWVKITYEYNVTDNSGDTATATSDNAEIVFQVNGVNNQPTVTGWTHSEGENIGTTITIAISEYVGDDPDKLDVDVNDTHEFYQVSLKDAASETGYSLQLITDTYQAVYDPTTGNYIGQIRFKAGSNKTELEFEMNYKTGYDASDTLKWNYSDKDGKNVATLPITLTVTDDSDADNAVSEAFTVTVEAVGTYNEPEIKTGQSIVISVSTEASAVSDDWRKAFSPVEGKVDAGYEATWSIAGTFKTKDSDGNYTVENANEYETDKYYFEIGSDGKLAFTDEAARTAFVNNFMPEDALECDIQFAVTLADNATTSASDTADVVFKVMVKMPPVVSPESVSTGIVVYEDGTKEGSTDITETVTYTGLGTDFTVNFAEDEDTVATPITGNRTGTYWYDFTASWNRNASYITYDDGTTNTIHFNATALAGYLEETDFANYYEVTNDGADYPDRVWSFNLDVVDGTTNEKVFYFLSEGDTATLVFDIAVTDNDFGCSTTVQITVNIKGVNDNPVIETTDPATTSVFEKTDVEDGGTYKIWGNTGTDPDTDLVSDPDWRDTVAYNNLTFGGGVIYNSDGTTVSSDAVTYFGMDGTAFVALLNGAESQSVFAYTTNTLLQKLPQDATAGFSYAILNYTFQAKDNNGRTSTSTKTVTIKVTGTNQNPVDIVDRFADIDLKNSSTENPTIDLREGITDIDTGDVDGLAAVYSTENWNTENPNALKIMVDGTDETAAFGDGFRTAFSETNGTITLDIAELETAFKSLQEDTVATVTFNYKVKDAWGAYCLDTDKTTPLEKTVTITITGKNEAPTQEDITGLTIAAGNTTGLEILWHDNSSDPDTVAKDDTRILAKVNDTAIESTIGEDGTVTYTAVNVDVKDANDNVLGNFTVSTTGVLTFFPSGDYLKWQLNAYGADYTSLDVPMTYLVKDQHDASTTTAASANVEVTGVFDKAVLDTVPEQTVPTVATPDTEGWVKLSKTIVFHDDVNETYTFAIDSVSVSGTGTFIAGDFKIVYNNDRSDTTGKATASVYVTKSALDTCNDSEDLPVVTVNFSYDNSQIGDHADSGTSTFDVNVIEKQPADIDDATGDIDQEAAATATVKWQLNGTAPEGTTKLEVTDPDSTSAGQAATVLAVDTTIGLTYTFKDAKGSAVIWALDTDAAAALKACFAITSTGEGENAVFTLTFTPSEAVYKFLPVGYTLEAVYTYKVTSYKSGDVTYDVDSPGTVTMTITGINDNPSAEGVEYGTVDGETVIKESNTDGITDIKLVDLFGNDTYHALYDIDGNPGTALNKRITDLASPNALDVWDPTLSDGVGGWVRLVAGSGTTANVYNSTNATAPTVQLVTVDDVVYLRVTTNGYYAYQASDTTMTFQFRAVDKAGLFSEEDPAVVASFAVKGEYVAPTFTGTMGTQKGDVNGYVISETETSDGKLIIDLKTNGFNYTAGTCDFSLNIPAEADTDFLVKNADGEIAEGTSYWFDKTDSANVKLVFQLISQSDYKALRQNADGYYTDVVGSGFDMSALEGITIQLDDGHDNTATSNTFDVKCNQQNAVELFLVATTDQHKNASDEPQKAGTQAKVRESGTWYYTNYINTEDLNTETISTQEAAWFGTGVDAKYGYYVEIWLQDNMLNYYGQNVNGVYQFQFMIDYNADTVKSMTANGDNDPGKDEDYNSSVGWGVVGGDGTKQTFYSKVRDKDTQEALDKCWISVAWNLNSALGITTPLASGTNTRYGMDGKTALLVCCLFVELESDVTPAAAGLKISAADKQYDVLPEGSSTWSSSEVGYTYIRDFRSESGFSSDAANKFALDDSQITSHYQQYTAIEGTSAVELVSESGIYVRTVSTPTQETVVKELSTNMNYLNEWQSHYAEIWVKASDVNAISEAGVTLSYNPNYFAPNEVEFEGILGQGNYTIDYETGTITIVAQASSTVAIDGYVLLGRVGFTALDVKYTDENGGLASTEIVGIPWLESNIAHDLGWSLGDGFVKLANSARIDSYLGAGSTTEVWAVPYDYNDDGIIGTSDYTNVSAMFGSRIEDFNYAVFFDFNRDGVISTSDYTSLCTYFGKTKASVAAGDILAFPDSFMQRYAGSTLQTGEVSSQVGQVLDAANNAWKETLGLDDTIDVQIYVTNLTNGDLAQATVTKTDANGLPTAGVIYLDDDGIGQTWYAQIKADNAASTKYDLYTVLLHELGHLYGYNMDDEQFSSIAGQFSFLADDGGHSTVKADLMYTDVDPGVRKDISVNDAYALATRYATYSAGYTIPESLANAWAAQNAVSDVVVEDAPAAAALAPQEEVLEGDSILVTMGTAIGVEPKEAVERATLDKLNALGVNIPGVTVIESADALNDNALDGLFPQEDNDDDDEISLIPEGNDNFESVIDSVLEEFGE